MPLLFIGPLGDTFLCSGQRLCRACEFFCLADERSLAFGQFQLKSIAPQLVRLVTVFNQAVRTCDTRSAFRQYFSLSAAGKSKQQW